MDCHGARFCGVVTLESRSDGASAIDGTSGRDGWWCNDRERRGDGWTSVEDSFTICLEGDRHWLKRGRMANLRWFSYSQADISCKVREERWVGRVGGCMVPVMELRRFLW